MVVSWLFIGAAADVFKTWIYLGVVTRWSVDGEDCSYDMGQFKFTVRRDSEDWKSIQVLTSEVRDSSYNFNLKSNALRALKCAATSPRPASSL